MGSQRYDLYTSIDEVSFFDFKIAIFYIFRLDYPIRSVSYSHCGNIIACGSEDRMIDVSWAQTGEKYFFQIFA